MQIPLTGFKQGDDITIMNTMSKRLRTNEGKFQELLTLVYKDNKTGIKHKQEIIDPDYTFFVLDDKSNHVEYNRLYIPDVKVKPITSPHKNVDREVAKILGHSKWFNDCIQSGNRREIKKIHTHPDVFMSDMNIEDHYRFWFNNNYKNDITPITKSYFDIEVDSISAAGDFPEMGECPVNAITIVFQHTMEVYTFLLRTKDNPQIKEFEQFLQENGTNELHHFVYDHVTEIRSKIPKLKNVSLGVENLKYKVLFYDEDKELEMMTAFFNLINTKQPDFAMAWNQAFDIGYLIARIQMLGGDPAYILSHKDFEYKLADYYVDERVLNEPEERCDFARISSYTTYLDQLIQYASRRKGQGKQILTLDNIGYLVAKVKKLDYKNITTNIAELPYKDYKTFVYYNVMDTIVQYCIEAIVEDIDYVFGKAVVNNTRYAKIHRQTVYLANRGAKEFYEDGYIIGNNSNKYNSPPTEKFPGAFVADPLKISDYSRMRINGHPTKTFNNNLDFDFASLHPSSIRQFNITAATQIGMIIIDQLIHSKENKRHDQQYFRGGAFLEDFQSHSWLEFSERWLKLLGYQGLVEYVYNTFMTKVKPSCSIGFEGSTGTTYFPIIDRSDGYSPIIIMDPLVQHIALMKTIKERNDYVEAHPNQSF